MATPFVGSIEAFGFNFAPKGWMLCNGQLLPIQQNQALFALLGTTYGGDGIRTFALPNLQSRVAIGFNGSYPIGALVGEENHTLLNSETPVHTHPVNAQISGTATSSRFPAATNRLSSGHSGTTTVGIYANMNPDTPLAPTGPAGGDQAHSNIMPCVTINYCIALNGIFPSRN